MPAASVGLISPPLAATFGSLAERAGLVALALAAAVALLAPAGRARALAMLTTLALAVALLVGGLWERSQLRPVRAHPELLAVLALVAVIALWLLARVVRRRPALLLGAAVAALPFRVPIHTGGDTVNLLVPLYGVIGVGVLAEALRSWGLARVAPEQAPATINGASAAPAQAGPGAAALAGWRSWGGAPGRRGIALALAAFVLAYALQASYSGDVEKALQSLAFFYAPFALLFVLLERGPWTPRLTRAAFAIVVALALAFVAVAAVQVITRHLFVNPRLIASNQLEAFFRPNSLFYDPNIYGRFVVLAMLAVAAAMLAARRRRELAAAVGVLAVLWLGLVTSLSQSSFAALFVGLAALAALRWGYRRVGAVVGAALVLGLAVVAVVPAQTTGFYAFNGHAFNGTTFGRYDLVKGGLELWTARPLGGWGSGSFSREYRREGKARLVNGRPSSAASHTIPVTILAEQGLVGFAAYAALLVVALTLLFRGAGRALRRATVAAAFLALVVHSLLYGAFLEDPTAWALLALGAAFAAAPPDAPAAASAARTAVSSEPIAAPG